MISQSNEETYVTEINPDMHKFPVVVSIPHSGLYIPAQMKKQLKTDIILTNSDWYLPDFYDFLEAMQFTVIENHINRYVIDVNREMVQEGDSYKTNLVYTHTTQGDVMYQKNPSASEISKRIENFYQPYHQALRRAVEEKRRYFDKIYVLDLHSFGLNYGADIILGNDYGKTCSDTFLARTARELQNQGFLVKENEVYPGGYITKHYHSLYPGCETLQMELWYGAYIKKREYGKEILPKIDTAFYQDAKKRMMNVFKSLAVGDGNCEYYDKLRIMEDDNYQRI